MREDCGFSRILRQPAGSVIGLSLGLWLALCGAAVSGFGARPAETWGQPPLYFEPARPGAGSYDFISRSSTHGVYLGATRAVLLVRRLDNGESRSDARSRDDGARTLAVHMSLVGADTGAKAMGLEEQACRVHYLIGSDPARWRRNVPTFGRVRFEAVYPGIDLIYHGNEGRLEHDFVVAPGARPDVILWRFEGMDRLDIDAAGDLVLTVAGEELRLDRPVAYQDVLGVRLEVEASFRLLDERTVGFAVGPYDPDRPLVIDPIIRYSTYLGGSQDDTAWAVAVNAAGEAYVAGETLSEELREDWILPVGAYQASYGGGTHVDGRRIGGDAFLVKLNTNGGRIFLTYLGGSGDDAALDVVTDAAGNAYVAGFTDSTNFPVTPGAARTNLIGEPITKYQVHPLDAFVAKIGPAGTNLIYSTYVGTTNDDVAFALAVDGAGAAYVSGYTQSSNYLVTCHCLCETNTSTNAFAYVTSFVGDPDFLCPSNYTFATNVLGQQVFVARLSPAGDAVEGMATLGGIGSDRGIGLALDDADTAVVAGITDSADLITTNVTAAVMTRAARAFLVGIDFSTPSAPALSFTNYLAGDGFSAAYAVRRDAAGCLYVAGTKSGAAFPGTGEGFNAGGVFKSTDGGNNWAAASAGLLHPQVRALAVNAAAPAQVLAGTPRGVFVSADGAGSWTSPVTNVASGVTRALLVDPSVPTTIYAGTSVGLFVSHDGGSVWTNANNGLTATDIAALAATPLAPGTVWAGARGGVFKSTNNAASWARLNSGLGNTTVNALAIDPTNAQIIYAGTEGGVYRSTNGGANWKPLNTGLANKKVKALAIDPVQPTTLYAGTARGLFKSVNGGTNWTASSGSVTNFFVQALAIDPAAPATLYAGATNGLFKSLDGGNTWTLMSIGLTATNIGTLAIDPVTPATLYAGALTANSFGGTNDAFLVKLLPDGTNIVYALTFGGSGRDEAWDLAVDADGNAYFTGTTTSTNLPVRIGGQATNSAVIDLTSTNQARLTRKHDAYVAAFDAAGQGLLYCSYHGGDGQDFGYGIAVDPAGSAYVVGQTARDGKKISRNFATVDGIIGATPQRTTPWQTNYAGGVGDAFITKFFPISVEMSVASVGGQAVISWPAPLPEFQLEASAVPQGGWHPVAVEPFVANNRHHVVLPASDQCRFFRLRLRGAAAR